MQNKWQIRLKITDATKLGGISEKGTNQINETAQFQRNYEKVIIWRNKSVNFQKKRSAKSD